MEHDLEIFDKDGKALHIASVISRFLFKQAEKHDKDVEDLVIGLEIIHPLRDDGCNKLQLLDCDFNLINEVVAQNGLYAEQLRIHSVRGRFSRDEAEAFLQSKDIWNHPYISDRTNNNGYEVADLMAEFANQFFRQ